MTQPYFYDAMKKLFAGLFLLITCSSFKSDSVTELNTLIDNWHQSAAKADFNSYFAATTDDFIFLATDPNERWTKEQFQSFCKPYFDAGRAWAFEPFDRHWNFSKNGKTAWFDERLRTWMRECRGSGIAVKTRKGWKLAYYNLTVVIENEKIQSFIQLRDRPESD